MVLSSRRTKAKRVRRVVCCSIRPASGWCARGRGRDGGRGRRKGGGFEGLEEELENKMNKSEDEKRQDLPSTILRPDLSTGMSAMLDGSTASVV